MTLRTPLGRRVLFAILLFTLAAEAICIAQTTSGDISEATPEELGKIEVYAASRHNQPAVSRVMTGEEGHSCHILFITSAHNRQTALLLGRLTHTSVLTVGEVEGFIQKGGIINFVSDNGHVRFEVNSKAADQGGFHISSRLLTVAKSVLR